MLAPSDFRLTDVSRGIVGAMSARVTIVTNPLLGSTGESFNVRAGTTIQNLLPVEFNSVPVVARYNGSWLLRKDWIIPLAPGDSLEFHSYPQGNNNNGSMRAVLTILVLIASYYFGPQVGGWFGLTGQAAAAFGGALISIAGSIAINAVIRPNVPQLGGGPGASASYNVALSGNQARQGQVIPVLYGYNQSFPDFAAQPYLEYTNAGIDSAGNSPGSPAGGAPSVFVAGDQYFYALFCIGHGDYFIHAVTLDDTFLSHFSDVKWNILPPGTKPKLVLANVATAIEVTGQEPKSGKWVGPFSACAPTLKASAVSFDIVFGGLGTADPTTGNMTSLSVTLQFEYREIDDLGSSIGSWGVFKLETITGATTDAIRKTFKYPLDPPKRVEVRVLRPGIKNDNVRVLNTPLWVGLRAYLTEPALLAPTATHLEVRMRASDQLNGLSQRKIAVRSTRMLSIWDGIAWSAPKATRSIAWALADKWRSTVYGDGLPDSRIDLIALAELNAIWVKRQDRFDFIFDNRMTSFDADQLIAGAGRAAVVRRQGSVRTVVRDQLQLAPLTVFTSSSIRNKSYSSQYMLPSTDSPDGIILEYWDNQLFDYKTFDCPAPGVTVMERPLWFRLLGVSGKTHAHREGLFLASAAFYRRRITTFSTELLGMIPTYGSFIRATPAMFGWGSSGHVQAYVASIRELSLREPVDFSTPGEHYVSVQRPNGSFTAPIRVTPGSDNYIVFLDKPLDFQIITDDPTREAPKYVFGALNALGTVGQDLVVRSVKPSSRDKGTLVVEISGVAENPIVHSADAHLLPNPDEVQDSPVTTPPTDTGGGTIPLVNIVDATYGKTVLAYDAEIGEWEVAGTDHPGATLPSVDFFTPVRIRFGNNGLAAVKLSDARDWVNLSGQWSKFGELELAQADKFEIMAEFIPNWTQIDIPAITSDSDLLGLWLPLDVTRMWAVDPVAYGPQGGFVSLGWGLNLKITIRTAGTHIVQDSAVIVLQIMQILGQDPGTGGEAPGPGGDNGDGGTGPGGDGTGGDGSSGDGGGAGSDGDG